MMSSGYTSLDNQNVSGSVPAVSGPDHVELRFPESNLQTFPPSETQGKITGTFRPPSDADGTCHYVALVHQGLFVQGSKEAAVKICYGNHYLLHLRFRVCFDILIHINQFSLNRYGPFWICSTLVFVAAALGNFVAYIAHKSRHEHWNNDINQVTWSAGLFYGYVAIVPLALYFVLKYLSVPAGLVQLWCLFGYSLFVFIPASCLSVIPLEILRWVVAGAAGLMSATFLAINLRSHIKTASDRWFLITAGIFLLQLGLAVVLKLYFFTIVFGKE